MYCTVSPCDFTFADIHTSLGHEAHPSLGLFAAEGAEVVDVRRLLCDLKVTDTAVSLHTQTRKMSATCDFVIIKTGNTMDLYLSTEVDHVCICIIIW